MTPYQRGFTKGVIWGYVVSLVAWVTIQLGKAIL